MNSSTTPATVSAPVVVPTLAAEVTFKKTRLKYVKGNNSFAVAIRVDGGTDAYVKFGDTEKKFFDNRAEVEIALGAYGFQLKKGANNVIAIPETD